MTGIVRHTARTLTGADGITVVLREDGDFCRYIDEEAIAPLWQGQRFPMDACVSGWVMRRGESAVIPDIYADARIPQDAYRPTFVKSLAMMPVRPPDAIAAIGAYWADLHTATPDELEILHRLADNTALALENIALREALAAEKRARAGLERAVADGRLTEAKLRESEARFRVMADTSPLMIWVTDANGNIEFVNRAYCQFFGVTEEDVRGPNWRSLVHPDDAERYVESFLRFLREGTPFIAEARVRRADGAWRYVASYGVPRLAADGTVVGAVGSSPDITDMKHAAAEAREAARLKDELIATVAHELRQPLHAAAAALGLMMTRQEHPAGERARSVLQRQFQHMSRMVEDLLDASRIVRGDVQLREEVVDLRDIVRDALETAGPTIHERQHELVAVVPDHPVRLHADAARLQQVLVNLLSNAGKYTPRAGRIRVSVEPGATDVAIRVQDNGIGIPADQLPRIFDVFARVENATEKGLGIGLAVARRLVERHRGRIEAHSHGTGRGSEFIVRLPTMSAGSDLAV